MNTIAPVSVQSDEAAQGNDYSGVSQPMVAGVYAPGACTDNVPERDTSMGSKGAVGEVRVEGMREQCTRRTGDPLKLNHSGFCGFSGYGYPQRNVPR